MVVPTFWKNRIDWSIESAASFSPTVINEATPRNGNGVACNFCTGAEGNAIEASMGFLRFTTLTQSQWCRFTTRNNIFVWNDGELRVGPMRIRGDRLPMTVVLLFFFIYPKYVDLSPKLGLDKLRWIRLLSTEQGQESSNLPRSSDLCWTSSRSFWFFLLVPSCSFPSDVLRDCKHHLWEIMTKDSINLVKPLRGNHIGKSIA